MTRHPFFHTAALPILNHRASYILDPNCCYQRIAKTIKVISIAPTGKTDHYIHKSASCDIGSIALSVGMGSPFAYTVDDHDTATLMISTGGTAQIDLNKHSFLCTPKLPALYLAGERYRCQIQEANGIELRLDRQKLAQSAMVMAEQSGNDGLDCTRLFQPWQIQSDSRWSMGLLGMLSKTLTYLDLTTAERSNATTARMERLLYQHIAAMLYPELMRTT